MKRNTLENWSCARCHFFPVAYSLLKHNCDFLVDAGTVSARTCHSEERTELAISGQQRFASAFGIRYVLTSLDINTDIQWRAQGNVEGTTLSVDGKTPRARGPWHVHTSRDWRPNVAAETPSLGRIDHKPNVCWSVFSFCFFFFSKSTLFNTLGCYIVVFVRKISQVNAKFLKQCRNTIVMQPSFRHQKFSLPRACTTVLAGK